MTIDHYIPTMSDRSTSGFRRPVRHCAAGRGGTRSIISNILGVSRGFVLHVNPLLGLQSRVEYRLLGISVECDACVHCSRQISKQGMRNGAHVSSCWRHLVVCEQRIGCAKGLRMTLITKLTSLEGHIPACGNMVACQGVIRKNSCSPRVHKTTNVAISLLRLHQQEFVTVCYNSRPTTADLVP